DATSAGAAAIVLIASLKQIRRSGATDLVERLDAQPLVGREALGAQPLDRGLARGRIERRILLDARLLGAVRVEPLAPRGALGVERGEPRGRLRPDGALAQLLHLLGR